MVSPSLSSANHARRFFNMVNKQNYSKTVSKEMRHIMDHAQVLVDATSGELDDRIKSARSSLKEYLDSTKGEYNELEGILLDKVQAADEFVHEKPYYVIGGAFIAGLCLRWFMSRK
jgi:ElaB/YqjD/DUF883 family membrane-anchored ribosome-binding protein